LLILIGLGLACSSADQTSTSDDQVEQANKLLIEAKGREAEVNELLNRSKPIADDLLGPELAKSKGKDIEAYKEKNKSRFAEVIEIREQSDKLGSELIGKLEEASKLTVPKVLDEYLDLRVEEAKKAQKINGLLVPFLKIFLKTKDLVTMRQQFTEYNKSYVEADQEHNEATDKLQQFQKENMLPSESN